MKKITNSKFKSQLFQMNELFTKKQNMPAQIGFIRSIFKNKFVTIFIAQALKFRLLK